VALNFGDVVFFGNAILFFGGTHFLFGEIAFLAIFRETAM
jgi:hypothetical protein